MREYQGHRSWNAWNVSLYISNEYHLYDDIRHTYRAERRNGHSHNRAVRYCVDDFMRCYGGAHTPDGAVYNRLCVKLAITDICEDFRDE